MSYSLKNCNACPLLCGADRTERRGTCGAAEFMEVAHIMLHRYEEPFISGNGKSRGSGAVFFAHCPLKCVYCQNHKISRAQKSKYREYSAETLSAEFLSLQYSGAYNINLVTPTHYTYQIIDAVGLARTNGLTVPVIWNTSGYENADTITELKNTANIFLTDFKYFDDGAALKYSGVKDYFKTADTALGQMLKNTGKPRFDKHRMMRSGVVVRHLLLPGCVSDSKKVIKHLYSSYGDNIYISIMSQFTPTSGLDAARYPELNRTVPEKEYASLVDYAADLGVTKALVQEGGAASESFIPDF